MTLDIKIDIWDSLRWLTACMLLSLMAAQLVIQQDYSRYVYTDLLSYYLGLGFIAGIVMSTVSDRLHDKKQWFYIVGMAIRYYAGFYMITSGYAKIDDTFFDVSLTTYNQVMIDASGRDFVWTFFGYTYGYQAIIGMIEIIGSAFLFFRNTKLLGSLLLAFILSNALLINYYYNLDRGIWTGSLLAISSYPIIESIPRLFKFFIQNKSVDKISFPFLHNPKLYNALGILKVIVILGPIVMYLWRMENIEKWTRHNYDHPAVGAWIIDEVRHSTPIDSTHILPKFKRLLLNKGRRGELITNDTTSGFEYIVDTTYDQFEMYNFYEFRDMDVKGKYIIQSPDTLLFQGRNQKDSLEFLMIRDKRFEERIRRLK